MDVIALIISIYGAALATFLGIREIKRQRRRLRIFLDHLAFQHRAQLTITNTGPRPVTIVGVSMEIAIEQSDGGKAFYDNVPQNALLATDEILPVTLGDGEQVVLPLSGSAGGIVIENEMRARLTVYDADGKAYKDFRRRMYNEKWGTYTSLAE